MVTRVKALVVSTATVYLRPTQAQNKSLDRKLNILKAGGLYEEGADIEAIFREKIEAKVIDLATGEYDETEPPEEYDQRKAAKDPENNVEIPGTKDKGGIKRRARRGLVYLVKEKGVLKQIILPVHGKGLWSTLYGFLALEADTTTVNGLAFYEHGETPGLGGEVDNKKWKAQWPGKKIFSDDFNEIRIEVLKGTVDRTSPEAIYQVDGLSGATITSRGVTGLLRYWMSNEGFGPFLKKIREGAHEKTGAADG